MFSFADETVFDPFAGSGTTSLAAMHLGRNSIGYELNKDFIPVIREKLCNDDSEQAREAVVTFCEDKGGNYSYDTLPYIFHDPHKMDKKVDVKKLQFGSKIDSSDAKKEELFTVKEVLSPEKILLSNGRTIKLLGVKERPDNREEAIEFLNKKFRNRKVFLKYDNIKYDDTETVVCYVYLDNKTFVNNHLIRTGFVDVDLDLDYSCKQKFLKSLPV